MNDDPRGTADRAPDSTAWHLPTAIALSTFVWVLLMAGHEALGHGVACVSLGGEAISLDAMYFSCSDLSPLWKDQLYRAAGSLFNVLLAGLSVLALGRIANPRSWLGYFLWTSAMLNLLQSGSYVAFGRFIHPGMDWALIVSSAPSSRTWGVIVSIVGLALLVCGLVVGRLYAPLFMTPDASAWRQKLRLLMTPYLTATVVSVAASMFVPSDDRFMMLMGGIGNSLFFLAPILLLLAPVMQKELLSDGPSLPARPGIIMAALVVTLLYIFGVAPGISIG